jgi:hypothetical protein
MPLGENLEKPAAPRIRAGDDRQNGTPRVTFHLD